MEKGAGKLKELENNLRELETFKRVGLDELDGDRKLQWALRYGLLESIQRMIDVACELVSRENLGYPDSYADCIRLLRREGYVNDELASRLVRAVGLRNILVHDYVEVDDEMLLGALERLDDLRAFARAVAGDL